MMQQEEIQAQEQLPIDDVSSPLSAQILEFCHPEYFHETLHNSEVTSSSCYDENISAAAASGGGSTTNNLSMIFDSQDELDNDISASIDFSSSPTTFPVPQFITTQQEQLDFSSVQAQLTLSDAVPGDGFSPYPADNVAQIMGHPLPSISVPSSYISLNPSSPSCSFLGPAISSYMAPVSMAESSIYCGGVLMGPELQPNELEYQAENAGIYRSDQIQRAFKSGELQGIGNKTTASTITSEISSMEDSGFKVGKLSVEQRKEKIHRYMKKRNERNFSKKIKYACRKTLADSRPRVRGRFAKNDEFGETHRAPCSSHDEDDDDGVVKEEDEMVDSADIFAHISGVNSFKCTHFNPILDLTTI